MKYLYCCGVDWQHEIGEASDIEGKMPFYSSVEELKEKSPCWHQCGIVKLKVQLKEWIEPQELFNGPKTDKKSTKKKTFKTS